MAPICSGTKLTLAQLPPPSLSSYVPFLKSSDPYGSNESSGLMGWFRGLKRGDRSAAGAYEPSGGHRGNFGALDPDEAWDSRVHDGHGYYEEQELETGYRGAGGARETDLGGSGYEMNLPRGEGDVERGRQGPAGRNPFDDAEELSIRGVSPRPMDGRRREEEGDRRSAFREDV